ncbi:MAG: gliding motility-associated C-terminal domain-containing protein, partial [Saprospiraceae bacterium]
TASGGTGTLEYSSDNGVMYQPSNIFTGLAIGSYDIVVKDANGCTTAVQSVSVTSCFSATVSNTTSVTCPGGNDGTVEITVTGGTTPYIVNGTSYNTNPFTITGLSDGAFSATVTENGGNSANISTTVNTTPDNTAPTVVTQDITVQLDASGNVTITTAQIDNNSMDNCGIQSMSLNVTTFDCSNVGANTVALIVTDVNGNSASANAIVTVEDTNDPTVMTQDVTVQLDANGNATVAATAIDNGSSDLCGGALNLSLDVSNFDCSDIGTNTVTLTVTDQSGNASTGTATVTVEDNLAPVIGTQSFTTQLDDNGQVTITAANINNGTIDNCTASPTLSLDITSFDCSNIGANTVTLTATDAQGNTAMATAIVTIEDNTPPSIAVKNATVALDENGNASISIADINDGTTDNCTANPTLSLDVTDFDCSDLGTNTVTLTATDEQGNISFESATVTVVDNMKPTLVCKPFTWDIDENGSISITAEDLIESVSDNCSYTTSISKSDFDANDFGDNIVTVTVEDEAGNVTTCEAIVSIEFNCLPLSAIVTPNDDGFNDTWQMGCLATVNNEVVIVNRLGQTIFQATNYTGDWNGRNNDGTPLPTGAYFYIVKATLGGLEQTYKGNITILKR